LNSLFRMAFFNSLLNSNITIASRSSLSDDDAKCLKKMADEWSFLPIA
jgi:hypothetical protein